MKICKTNINANIFAISLFCAVDSISNASFNFHFENKDTCSSFNCKFLRAECLCEKNFMHIMHVCWICSIFRDRIGKYLQGSFRLDHNYSKVIRYIGNKYKRHLTLGFVYLMTKLHTVSPYLFCLASTSCCQVVSSLKSFYLFYYSRYLLLVDK